MKCTKCGNEVQAGTLFCDKCGEKIEQNILQYKYCGNCGAKMNINEMFCGNCGQRADGEVEAGYQKYVGNNQPIPPANKGFNIFLIVILVIIALLIAGLIVSWIYIKNKDNSEYEDPEETMMILEKNTSEENLKETDKAENSVMPDITPGITEPTPEQPSVTDSIINFDALGAIGIPQENTSPSIINNNYIFNSDTVFITNAYLDTLSKEQVRLILNEMYARHGYKFGKEPYLSYFSSKPWYVPIYETSEETEVYFNEIETQNKITIVNYEVSKGWR